jgi:DNA mismatch repair protein MutS
VAKLAGLPPAVIERAFQVLETLEAQKATDADNPMNDLPLFSATPKTPARGTISSEVEEALRDIHPDSLTPREALEVLYDLRKKLKTRDGT